MLERRNAEIADFYGDDAPRRGLITLSDGAFLKAVRSALGNASYGRLTVRLPSGRTETFGDAGPEATALIRRYRALWRGVRRGALGFAEAYINGDLDTPDLGAVFRYYTENYGPVRQKSSRFFKARIRDKVAHRLKRNTRAGSRRNISAHYDLGNDFYRFWLDEGMTYSSAVYRHPEASLEEAQTEKYDLILKALDLKPGQSLLEIGCGWGGMAETAVKAGACVTGITISAEQLAYAKRRLESQKRPEICDLRFQDYRDVKETFDRIVSIEMIEAVGEEHWPKYFATLHDRLAPGGAAVIQAITIDEPYFDDYRRRPDFIQRYIFPGGMLPTVSKMEAFAKSVGLKFETIERFGESYARTLIAWRERFRTAWPHIANLGFDERFRRMWEFYLTYCEVGFERATIDVGVYRLRKALA